MNQLTMGAILQLANNLKKEGMTTKEIADLPIYIGRDDELNGIHTAWYVQTIDPNKEDDEDFIDLINEDHGNVEIKGKSILIS